MVLTGRDMHEISRYCSTQQAMIDRAGLKDQWRDYKYVAVDMPKVYWRDLYNGCARDLTFTKVGMALRSVMEGFTLSQHFLHMNAFNAKDPVVFLTEVDDYVKAVRMALLVEYMKNYWMVRYGEPRQREHARDHALWAKFLGSSTDRTNILLMKRDGHLAAQLTDWAHICPEDPDSE